MDPQARSRNSTKHRGRWDRGPARGVCYLSPLEGPTANTSTCMGPRLPTHTQGMPGHVQLGPQRERRQDAAPKPCQ